MIVDWLVSLLLILRQYRRTRNMAKKTRDVRVSGLYMYFRLSSQPETARYMLIVSRLPGCPGNCASVCFPLRGSGEIAWRQFSYFRQIAFAFIQVIRILFRAGSLNDELRTTNLEESCMRAAWTNKTALWYGKCEIYFVRCYCMPVLMLHETKKVTD